MVPKGYLFAAAECGLKSKGLDLAIIYSLEPAQAVAKFTTNKVFAAPIQVSREHLAASESIRAIVANSGNANACTGEAGVEAARQVCAWTAEALKIKPEEVLIASTGIIGRPLPLDKLKAGLDAAMSNTSPEDVSQVAQAIMTTDTYMKSTSRPVEVEHDLEVVITGITKGAGMISPKLATMLCFVVTDAALDKQCAEDLLTYAVERSFNHVTIDGDMSTNDCVFMLYNGAAGNQPLTPEHPKYEAFRWSLTEVLTTLAKMMARDGEGATKLVEVRVKGAATPEDAELCARAVANSPLVKTAFFGGDPNWGRIAAAAGRSGAQVDPSKLDIYYQDVKLVEGGREVPSSYGGAKQVALRDEFTLTLDLHQGEAETWIWTCDLSYDYIEINAEYHT